MYNGSCHCKNVEFTVDADISNVMECNCSMCSKKGFLLAMVPSEQINVKAIKKPLTRYRFNKEAIMHDFCPDCGVQCFASGEAEGKKVYAVNVRTIQDIDHGNLEITKVDGKSL